MIIDDLIPTEEEQQELKKFTIHMPKHEHIRCNCGGHIVSDRGHTPFVCDRCGREFAPYTLDYDRLAINDKTGWIFPVKDKEKYEYRK